MRRGRGVPSSSAPTSSDIPPAPIPTLSAAACLACGDTPSSAPPPPPPALRFRLPRRPTLPPGMGTRTSLNPRIGACLLRASEPSLAPVSRDAVEDERDMSAAESRWCGAARVCVEGPGSGAPTCTCTCAWVCGVPELWESVGVAWSRAAEGEREDEEREREDEEEGCAWIEPEPEPEGRLWRLKGRRALTLTIFLLRGVRMGGKRRNGG